MGKIVLPDGTTKEGYFENNIYRGALPKSSMNHNQSIMSKRQKSVEDANSRNSIE
jgi:hypothetical protein